MATKPPNAVALTVKVIVYSILGFVGVTYNG